MTNEKAIDIMENERPHCGKSIVFTEEEKCEAFEMAIAALKREQWIPVSERLPEKKRHVHRH